MNQFKRAQVIMLPTEENTKICLGNNLSYIYSPNPKITLENTWNELRKYNKEHKTNYNPQHLYILSDDEIKEGDYFLADNRISQSSNSGKPNWIVCKCTEVKNTWKYCNEIPNEGHNGDWSKKIIATTDTSIKIFAGKGDICDLYYNLPQPSQQFIEKYIEEYNKGEIIESIMVEYEEF